MSKIIQFPEQLDSFEYKRVKISELILSHEVDQATQLYRKWFMAKETDSGQQTLLSFTVWKSGQELEREEEYELAAKCHRAVVDMDPTHQSAYKRLFLCLERSGQYEAAIRVCDEAIGMEEGNIFRDQWTKGGWYGRRSRATKKLEHLKNRS
jgi:tetratricopeptide (TPR) repeat protein